MCIDISNSLQQKGILPLEHLKQISPIFKTEYRRHGCTTCLPVGITVEQFWHNYNYLNNRFRSIKQQLSEPILSLYYVKFHKKIVDRDYDLVWFIKQVEFVAKYFLIEDPNRIILEEIISIADRYQKGFLFKVPLDKEMQELTSVEYFFFAPFRWCFSCQKSCLIDEITVEKKCRVCNNKLYSVNNSFIGFIKSKRYPFLNCLPCCYKTGAKAVKRITELNLKHPTHKR